MKNNTWTGERSKKIGGRKANKDRKRKLEDQRRLNRKLMKQK